MHIPKKVIMSIFLTFILLYPPSLGMEKKEGKDGDALIAGMAEGDFSILYPRCSDPAIVERGAEFEILINASDFTDIKSQNYTI